MTKYREGSAGAAEQKAYRIFRMCAIVVLLALLGVMFVFNTEYRDAVKFTSTVWNVLGAALLIAGFGCIEWAYRAGEGGSYGPVIAWGVMSAAGFLIAACQGL